jgi:hypothetical protein
MYELKTSDDAGRTWAWHGVFMDLERAKDAAR